MRSTFKEHPKLSEDDEENVIFIVADEKAITVLNLCFVVPNVHIQT
jgi:hypothetical protein